jgi:hypothetical protein
MGSNHELDEILNARNLLILQSLLSRPKPQKQVGGTKSVQNILEQPSNGYEIRDTQAVKPALFGSTRSLITGQHVTA